MAKPEGAPPRAVMSQIITGQLLSRCVSLVAELAIADHLKNGPQGAPWLAATTGTNPDALYRVLRMLASLGIFSELPNRQFQNSALSEILCSDAPDSLRDLARWFGTAFHCGIVADLDYSVQTGNPTFIKHQPEKTAFEVLSQDQEAQRIFNDAMTGLSLADGSALVQSYDFSRFARVIDVGGGHGTLAVMIARAAPQAKVRVLDLAHVIDGAKKRIEKEGLEDRIEAIAGSFLDKIPAPADLCTLKRVIHDWDDDISRRILTNCRNALEDGGRVLVCETLITPGPESIAANLFDIEMLVGPGGRERTEPEFAQLFAAAGLKLNRVIETSMPIRLLEGVKA
jgi:ubiquinone/menaquinone biosynthesis C-methylase UbiE